jgi:hypothetical protein
MRRRFFLILLLGLCCMGMGKKKPELDIRFYTETSQSDTGAFAAEVTLLTGRRTYLDQVAAISEHDIAGIYPFPAQDGSAGCSFKLDARGTIALDTLSVAKRGTYLVAVIDGRQVVDIMIDQRVSDGIVTIANGITLDEVKQMEKQFSVIGTKKK